MFQLMGSYVPWSLGLPVITTVYFIPSSGRYLHISSKQILISNSSCIYKNPFSGLFLFLIAPLNNAFQLVIFRFLVEY